MAGFPLSGFHRRSYFAGAVEYSYTASMNLIIRDVTAGDLDEILSLNEEVVPAVNSIPFEQMRWFAERASYFRVATADDRLAAFLIGLRPGTSYESLNYLWFCKHYEDFAYVDRIAVASHARRLGLATKMYDDFKDAIPDSVGFMTCEVNLQPPNESSMQFHERYGFSQVASQITEGGSKEVALLVKTL